MRANVRRRRVLGICLAVLAALALLAAGALVFIGNYFYQFALVPSSDSFFGGSLTGGDNWPETENDRWFEGGETVTLESEDALSLNAYQFFDQTGHRYAVVCHGYASDAATMTDRAHNFYQMGFNVLLPDARGFGASEGDYAGMGWKERRDIVGWCNYILERDAQAQIILYGISMGGATVMTTAGEADLPQAVKLVIEDCGYTSVWDEFSAQLEQIFGLPPFPILNVTSLVTQVRAGWGFREASALEQIKNCTIPVLFIHGEADAFVPFEMVYRLYAAATCPKEIFTVPDAGHGMCASTDPEGYWHTIADFLAEYLPD